MKLSQMQEAVNKTILLFGPPKSGKTSLFGTLASEKKLILFDLENGSETLIHAIPKEFHDNVEIIKLPDTRSFPIAIETMLKVIKGGPVEICEEHGKVGCMLCKKENKPFTKVELNKLGPEYVVGVDSLTQLTNSAIAHITKGQPEDYKLTYDDWGNLGKLMDMFLSYVQNAKFNIVCITHETEAEMEDGKAKLVPTAGTRNFSRNSARYFSDVVYCEVKNRKHIAASSTTYANNILTGSRSGIRLEDSQQTSLLSLFRKGGPASESGISSETNTNPAQQQAASATKDLSALAATLRK